jgi:AcrR family transcriptional regulator
MRADARDNRDRVLRAAKVVFTEQGAQASLNKIAQRAGVGPGTLYRHFPTLQDLLVAIIGDDVEALCAKGNALLTDPSPERALRTWLRAVAVHATAMRGLVATEMAVEPSPALAACHDLMRETGAALLIRTDHDADVVDLLRLMNAIAWASEQAPDDPGLLDRLLEFALGVRTGTEEA